MSYDQRTDQNLVIPADDPPERTPEAPERIWRLNTPHLDAMAYYERENVARNSAERHGRECVEYVRADLVRAATTGSPEGTVAAKNAVIQELARMGVFADDGRKRDELAWSCADAALRSSAPPPATACS